MYDQTDPQQTANVAPDELGTGLFLVPPPNPFPTTRAIGVLVASQILDVTYRECRVIAALRDAHAMKWVPHRVGLFGDLQATRGTCGQPCTGTCVEIGCLCNEITHRCQSAL